MPRFVVHIPNWSEIKQTGFWFSVRTKLICLIGKHMPGHQLEHTVAVFEESNAMVLFSGESAQIVKRCFVCGKVFGRRRAEGFQQALLRGTIPDRYPLDPAQPMRD